MLSASKLLSTASRMMRRSRGFSTSRNNIEETRLEAIRELQQEGLFLPSQKVLTCGESNFEIANLLGKVMGASKVLATSPYKIGAADHNAKGTIQNLQEMKEVLKPITRGLINPYQLSSLIKERDMDIILFVKPRFPLNHQHYGANLKKNPLADDVVTAFQEMMSTFIDECKLMGMDEGKILMLDDIKGPHSKWGTTALANKYGWDDISYELPWGGKSKYELIGFEKMEA